MWLGNTEWYKIKHNYFDTPIKFAGDTKKWNKSQQCHHHLHTLGQQHTQQIDGCSELQQKWYVNSTGKIIVKINVMWTSLPENNPAIIQTISGPIS